MSLFMRNILWGTHANGGPLACEGLLSRGQEDCPVQRGVLHAYYSALGGHSITVAYQPRQHHRSRI